MSLRAWLLLLVVGCLLEVPSLAAAQPTTYRIPHRPRLMGDELSELERQRAELSLGGPIAWTIVGGVTALTGASVLLIGVLLESLSSSCEPADGDYYGSDGHCSDPDTTPFIVIGAVGLVAGAVVLAVALPWMIDRIGERHDLGLRIKELRRQRDGGGALRPPLADGPRLVRAAPVFKLRF